MRVISCKILERNIDEKSPNYDSYESELRVGISGVTYNIRKVTSNKMVESGYISHDSQRAYMQYEMVQEVANKIRDTLNSQINQLNIRERVKPR